MVALRRIAEPRGKQTHRGAKLVAQLRALPDVLAELRKIVEKGGAEAHSTASLAKELLDNPEWMDSEHGKLRDEAEAELDRLTRMIALTLDELLAMIKFFPDIKHWDKADLCALRDSACFKQKEEDDQRRAKERARQEAAGGRPPIGTGMSSNGRVPEQPASGSNEPTARTFVSGLAAEYDHKLKEKAAIIAELNNKQTRLEREAGSLHKTVATLQVRKQSDAELIIELMAELAAVKAELAKEKQKAKMLLAENKRLKGRKMVRAGR